MTADEMWRVYHIDAPRDLICYCPTKETAMVVAYYYVRDGFIVSPGEDLEEVIERFD